MKCIYLHKSCPTGGCDNYLCRAYFPERQPLIKKDMLPTCQSSEYLKCERYVDAVAWREKQRRDKLKIHCKFASNSRCGRSWEWWCKGGNYPFLLTTYEVRDGTDDIPLRDEKGNIKFTRTVDQLKDVCFSGKTEVYEECPHYKAGIALREYVNQLKKQGKENNSE